MNSQNRNTTHQPLESTVNGRPVTDREVAYRNGYVNGRVTENRAVRDYEREQANRDTNNTAWGLLLGILLTSVAGLAIGSMFFFDYANRRNIPVGGPTPTAVPVPSSNNNGVSPRSTPETQRSTTVIERNVERTQQVVPIPQRQPEVSPEPRVEINVPQQPATIVPQPQQNSNPAVNDTLDNFNNQTTPDDTGAVSGETEMSGDSSSQ